MWTVLASLLFWTAAVRCPAQIATPGLATQALEAAGQGTLKEVPYSALSNPYASALGTAAFTIRPTEWKHAETENFIYHFFHGFVAAPVSTEAEFYYRVIARDLGKDTSRWERKAQIFIFEGPDDWKQFQTKAHLDPWTGGIHSNNELFIQRDPSYKFKGWSLGHETAHLVVNRFFGSNVPLWLNEGYAEYVARVAYASFYRARGYDSHPRTSNLPPDGFIPVEQLANMVTYPAEVPQVLAFYIESEKLVRFLNAADKAKFLQLLDNLSKGSLFENALHNAYGTRFPSPHLLEEEFRPVAIQQAAVAGTSSAGGVTASLAHTP